MNGLFSAAEQVQVLCRQEGWAFCFIGGLAVQRWGEPRVMLDVDLTLLAGFGTEEAFVERLTSRFDARVADVASSRCATGSCCCAPLRACRSTSRRRAAVRGAVGAACFRLGDRRFRHAERAAPGAAPVRRSAG
ncbi:MAG: hypothetical protein WKF47_10995 [Geodermatophilaceae bacterium]